MSILFSKRVERAMLILFILSSLAAIVVGMQHLVIGQWIVSIAGVVVLTYTLADAMRDIYLKLTRVRRLKALRAKRQAERLG